MLRLLVVALACASSVYAADTEDRLRKSVPVSSATRLTLNAEFGSIGVQPGTGTSVDVEVYFRGDPYSRGEFDRMLRDFRLDVNRQGSEILVNGMFVNGWEPFLSSGIFDLIFGHQICHNG